MLKWEFKLSSYPMTFANKIMLKGVAICSISGILFCGCTVTREVSTNEEPDHRGDSMSANAFNEEVHQRQVTINVRGAQEFQAEDVILTGDSLEFNSVRDMVRTKMPANDIAKISWKDHVGGALDGAIFSIIPILLVSLDWPDVGGGTHPGGGAAAGAAVGGIGIVSGGLIGKAHVYKFVPNPNAKK